MPRFLPKLATRHRLVALAAVSIGLSLATAALGHGAAGALADALRRATAASSAAYDFMLGDMMHDALHADVLIALRTGPTAAPEARQAAGANLKEHAATFRAALAALRKLELDEELRLAIAGVEQPIEAYIAQAEEIAALAYEDVAAAEARYPSFFATFESLEAANGRVGELIDARSAAIGAAGEARTARAQTTLALFSLGTIVLVAAGAVAVGLSIARRDASEARMRHMAFHDALTGLPNRTLFRERLGEALSRMRRTNESVAVLCLDLDRFKDVNDALGHPAGDLLLKVVAARLKGCVRESDTVARLGGDEFAILQLGVGQPEGVSALAQRLLHVLGEPMDLDGHRTVSAGSIGVAIAPTDGEVPDELIRNADIALYRAKGDGRGVFRFFEAEMDARLQARRRLEYDLREALSEGRFELHYQPQVEPASGRLTGFEALLRWRDPGRGMVPPSEFIPLAEETGLILPLGEWVLRRACADAVGWPASLRVAVNLSPVQFRRADVVELVSTVLRDIRLAPGRLELEITEGTLLHDTAAILTALDGLRAMGVRIAMDDFGTGYSSLSYLRRFPFDKIKIDRSFVQALDGREDNAAVVRAIIGLGRSLGMATTAEGVETEDQLAVLRAEGCDEVQGYLLGRPQPLGTVEAMMMALEGRADSRPRPVASGRLAPA